MENVWITYHFFNEIVSRPSKHWTYTTWREDRWTGDRKDVLPGDYRVFLTGDRQTKCVGGDRQRTVWCLNQHELRYLCNRRTEYTLTVSFRRRDKLGCRSNSLSFCVTHPTSHVSSYLFSFRCLDRHVCETYGPVTRKTVWTMVDVSQVMIDHNIICKIHDSRLTTLMRWTTDTTSLKSWPSWVWNWNSYLLSF